MGGSGSRMMNFPKAPPLKHLRSNTSSTTVTRGDPCLSDSEKESAFPQPYVHRLEVTRPDFIIHGLKAFLLALAGKPESAFAAPDQRQTGRVGYQLNARHSLGSPLKLIEELDALFAFVLRW